MVEQPTKFIDPSRRQLYRAIVLQNSTMGIRISSESTENIEISADCRKFSKELENLVGAVLPEFYTDVMALREGSRSGAA